MYNFDKEPSWIRRIFTAKQAKKKGGIIRRKIDNVRDVRELRIACVARSFGFEITSAQFIIRCKPPQLRTAE